MDCPLCKTEMFIDHAEYLAENDDTPLEETRILHRSICRCRNANCKNYKKKFSGGVAVLPRENTQKLFCHQCGLLLYEGTLPNDEQPVCPICGEF